MPDFCITSVAPCVEILLPTWLVIKAGVRGPKGTMKSGSQQKKGPTWQKSGLYQSCVLLYNVFFKLKVSWGKIKQTKVPRYCNNSFSADMNRLHVNLPQQEAGRCVNGCRIPIRWVRTFMASTWFPLTCQPWFRVFFPFLLWQVKIPAVKSGRFSPGSCRDSPGTPNPPRRSRSHTGNMA